MGLFLKQFHSESKNDRKAVKKRRTIKIGYMEPEDRKAVLKIYGEAICREDVTLVTVIPSWEDWDKEHDPCCRYVARIDENTVGFLVLRKIGEMPLSGKYLGEISIYVDKNYRKRGIGLSLLKRAVKESGFWGYAILRSRIFPENHASIALHQKAGFHMTCYRTNAAQKNGSWRDVCVFERRSMLF